MSSQPSPNSQAALDIMAQLQDPQWAMAAAQLEDEANCTIGAGPELGVGLAQLMADPHSFHQLQQLQDLVLHEFRRMLTNGNLGVGTDAAWKIGRARLLLRLQQPSPEIQAQLKSVLAEAPSTPEATPLSTNAQALLQQAICSALTVEDWDDIAIAAANAIQHHIMQHLQLPKSA